MHSWLCVGEYETVCVCVLVCVRACVCESKWNYACMKHDMNVCLWVCDKGKGSERKIVCVYISV